MLNARRNLIFRVSILINIVVLLYAALHMPTTKGPYMQWTPVGERAESFEDNSLETTDLGISDMRNYSADITQNVTAQSSGHVETTSIKFPPGKGYTETTTVTPQPRTDDSLNRDERSQLYPTATQNDLLESTLDKLNGLLGCSDRSNNYEIRQRGDYWVLMNYVRAKHGAVKCYETITYTTHAGFEFLDNVIQLVERWRAPISVAVYAPGDDFKSAVESIMYLRDCNPGQHLVQQFVTFHIFFSSKHLPNKIPDPDVLLMNAYDCSIKPPYMTTNVTQTYMRKRQLLYPVNVARNIAREAALTYFLLPSDIELYPSPNVIPQFLNMIARNEKPLDSKNPRVFPLSIFEVDEKYNVPLTKTELLAMLKNNSAVPFHKYVCPKCHNIPKGGEWIATKETKQMDVFHVGKRNGAFLHWEPIFIGTHIEPYYDERLSWEGKSDKMTQGYVLCVKDYDFMILNNAFLVHKPGIKRYKYEQKRAIIAAKQSKLIKTVITPELKRLYGERRGCVT